MDFVIPSSKNRMYLSGQDWVINTIDHMMKSSTCTGNMSQIVFVLDAFLDEKILRKKLGDFVEAFPALYGSISRDYSLAPYWKIPEKVTADLNLTVYNLEEGASEDDISSLIEKAVNLTFRSDNEHLAFHLIQKKKNESIFSMTFDHRLFDARGAESFLDLFLQYSSGRELTDILKGIRLTAPADLSDWMNKFHAGRNVNRKMMALSKPMFETLPLPEGRDRGFRFHLVSFDNKDTEKIYEKACSEAGYLMEMPYLLSVVMQAVHGLFKKRGIDSDNYMAPVTIDIRTSEDVREELLLNHVSYLFFKIKAEDIGDIKNIIRAVKLQMFDQVKSKLSKDLAEASSLLRIASFSFLGKVLYLHFKGNPASFLFSYLGDRPGRTEDFMGLKIRNIFHTPRVPVPPGLGFFFNYFNGRLNFVISYLEGLLSDDEIRMLVKKIKEKMESPV
jgi:hypothetical protein